MTAENAVAELMRQGRSAKDRWDLISAVAAFEQALHIFEDSGDLTGQGHAWQELASVYRRAGRWPDALVALQRALDLVRARADSETEYELMRSIAVVQIETGDWTEARRMLEGLLASS